MGWDTTFLRFARESGMEKINVGPYKATLDHDRERLIIHDVEIFHECERKGISFDQGWLKKVLRDAQGGEKRHYFPPVHVQHHGDEGVRAVGVFRMKRIAKRWGKDTLIADLIVTNPGAVDEIIAGRLPYRSVEIMDRNVPKIDSLALLDHEPPYLELPAMLDVSNETNGEEWEDERVHDEGAVLAFGRRGKAFRVLMMERDMDKPAYRLLFQKDEEKDEEAPYEEADTASEAEVKERAEKDAPENTDTEEPTPDADVPDLPMADEGPIPGSEEVADPLADPDLAGAEEGTFLDEVEEPAGPINADAVIAAIKDGTIALKDFHAIHQAMEEIEAGLGMNGDQPMPTEEQPAQPEGAPVEGQKPSPAAAAPAEAMKRKEKEDETPEYVAKLIARVESLEADAKEREVRFKRENEITKAVRSALERLSGRVLGEKPEDRFVAFARKHGLKAFGAYIDEIERTAPVARSERIDEDGFDFGSEQQQPEEVMHFAAKGDDALERAIQLRRQHDELKRRGMVRVDLKRYLDIHMNGLGV